MNPILIIEDNEKLQKYISEYLSAYGYQPEVLRDYGAVCDTIAKIQPKLILLDINLPQFDGFYYLKLIRKQFQIPVIILSARSEEAEQIRGLEGGADDYITKPFSMGVLLAKIAAMIRKAEGMQEQQILGEFRLSAEQMTVQFQDKTVELSKNEFRILRLFLKNGRQITTREQLLEELWDDSSFIDDNTLTVNITRVRKKLEEVGLFNVITTKRGVGYVLETDHMGYAAE